MVIQTLVYFICIMFAVFLIIIPILYGTNLMLFHIIGKMWWVSCSPHFRRWVCPVTAGISAKACYQSSLLSSPLLSPLLSSPLLSSPLLSSPSPLLSSPLLSPPPLLSSPLLSSSSPLLSSPLNMLLTLTFSSEGPSGWCCSWLCSSSMWPPGFCSSRRTQEPEIWTTGANYI